VKLFGTLLKAFIGIEKKAAKMVLMMHMGKKEEKFLTKIYGTK